MYFYLSMNNVLLYDYSKMKKQKTGYIWKSGRSTQRISNYATHVLSSKKKKHRKKKKSDSRNISFKCTSKMIKEDDNAIDIQIHEEIGIQANINMNANIDISTEKFLNNNQIRKQCCYHCYGLFVVNDDEKCDSMQVQSYIILDGNGKHLYFCDDECLTKYRESLMIKCEMYDKCGNMFERENGYRVQARWYCKLHKNMCVE